MSEPLFPEPEPGERQQWAPQTYSPDCIICNPLGHVGCGCSHRRCAFHADAVDPIPDRPALAQAYRDFHQADREERRLAGEAYAAGERRAELARLVQQLGGRL